MNPVFEAIEKFEPIAPGVPGEDAVAAYQRDGVVCLKKAFGPEWVEKGRRAVAAALRAPGNLQRRNRRRAICTHWFGDDARYANKTSECSPNERGENLVDGGPLECATFPRFV